MPRFVVKHSLPSGEDRYLIWSSVVDAPVFFGMTLGELREFWKEAYGREGLEYLNRDIERNAFSSIEDEWCVNRAGKGQTRLSVDQIVDYYITRGGEGEEPIGESWTDIFAREDAEAL